MIRAANLSASSNLPIWRDGWTDSKTGSVKNGFWQFRHNGKYVSLTRYGSPAKQGGKPELNLAIAARDAYLAEIHSAPEPEPVDSRPTVADVLNFYDANHCPTQSAKVAKETRRVLKLFATGSDSGLKGNGAYKGFGALLAEDLKEHHLDSWKAAHPRWATDKPLEKIKAAFAFAKKKGLIDANPLAGFKIKVGKGRGLDFLFTDEEETKFKAAITNKRFATFFEASIELGTRPGELARIQPRHCVERDGRMFWVLQANEWKCGKKTGRPRIIALPQKWQDWTREQLAKIPANSHLFRNGWGNPWKSGAWESAFNLAAQNSGIRPVLSLYAARSTYISRKLKAGTDIHNLARACGTSTKEIERVYDKTYGDFDLMASVVG
jgi:integrase